MAGLALAGRAATTVLDLLLPPRCLGCGAILRDQASLCAGCWARLAFIEPPLCRSCGYPLPHALPEEPICGSCAAAPPVFDRARAALRYDEGSRGLILAFKHADRTDISRALGTWMARVGAPLLAEADLVVPVPLHRWRLLRRGYNQAAILARSLRLPGASFRLVPDLLQRRRRTPSQQGLSAEARLANVTRTAFRLHPRHRAAVEGRRVLLIDDVLTTGATVQACASVLRTAGASAVDLLTLARVVRDGGRAHIGGTDQRRMI